MRLADLNPELREGGYLEFDCPAGHPHRICIPIDPSVHSGAWNRTGEFPETLTLTPSILAYTGTPTDWEYITDHEKYRELSKCGWHGYITNGDIINA